MSEPKYKRGDVLRYAGGPTALMLVTYVSPNHGGDHRYYGVQCMGGFVGAYQADCQAAGGEDMNTWEKHRCWRRDTRRIDDARIIGRVEDR